MNREAAEALVAGLDHDGKAEVLGAALRGVEAALEAAGRTRALRAMRLAHAVIGGVRDDMADDGLIQPLSGGTPKG